MSALPGFVKLFGERNTATNALRALCQTIPGPLWLPSTADQIDPGAYARVADRPPRERERGIDAIFSAAGDRSAWKHCATTFQDIAPFVDCLVLFTVRHPASWLAGLFANPYHALAPLPATLAEFLSFQWETAGRERLGGKILTPLQLHAAKLASYNAYASKLEQAGIPVRFIRFEDVVLAQEQVFSTVASALGVRDAAFQPLVRSTKDPSRTLDDYREYYGHERWRAVLSGSEAAINAQVDWASVARFGYLPL